MKIKNVNHVFHPGSLSSAGVLADAMRYPVYTHLFLALWAHPKKQGMYLTRSAWEQADLYYFMTKTAEGTISLGEMGVWTQQEIWICLLESRGWRFLTAFPGEKEGKRYQGEKKR